MRIKHLKTARPLLRAGFARIVPDRAGVELRGALLTLRVSISTGLEAHRTARSPRMLPLKKFN